MRREQKTTELAAHIRQLGASGAVRASCTLADESWLQDRLELGENRVDTINLKLLVEKSRALRQSGDLEAALRSAQIGMNHAVELRADDLIRQFALLQAAAFIQSGDFTKATAILKGADFDSNRCSFPHRIEWQIYQGHIERANRQLKVAIEHYKQALDLSLTTNFDLGAANALQSLAIAEQLQGNDAAASRLLPKAIKHFEKARHHLGAAQCKLSLAELSITAKRWNVALNLLQTAVESFANRHEHRNHADALLHFARLHALIGCSHEATMQLQFALRLAQQYDYQLIHDHCHYELGKLALSKGAIQEAQEHFAAIVSTQHLRLAGEAMLQPFDTQALQRDELSPTNKIDLIVSTQSAVLDEQALKTVSDWIQTNWRELTPAQRMQLQFWASIHAKRTGYVFSFANADRLQRTLQAAQQYLPKNLQEAFRQKWRWLHSPVKDASSICPFPSKSMSLLFATLPSIATSDLHVHIEGESGSGKEWLARQLHLLSNRSNKTFFAVDCGTLQETLMESTLFGHVQGAFTGAQTTQLGVVAAANGGTLFLKNIDELTASQQARLLRLFVDKKFNKVGSTMDETADIRIVTSSRQSLLLLLKQGKIRTDLFHRISGCSLTMPALRQRRIDIALIVANYFENCAPERRFVLTPKAQLALKDHDWPGNVRQLLNELKRLSIFKAGQVVHAMDLFQNALTSVPIAPTVIKPKKTNLTRHLRSLEQEVIVQALQEHQGNLTLAATALGIKPFDLRRRMKRLKLRLS